MAKSIEGDFGLVLAGGGGKGAYQAGVLKALYEYGFTNNIVAVSGSSIGALNACLFSSNDVSLIDTVWDEVDLLTVFDTELSLIDLKEGTFSRDGMRELISKYKLCTRVSKSNIKVYATISKVINDSTFEANYACLNNMPEAYIEQVMIASSALPLIYEDVVINGSSYRDGGLSDNLPIKPLYDLGIRNFIVIGLGEYKKELYSKYSDAEFFDIYPSHTLGDLTTGTLNFTKKSIRMKKKLGYMDGIREIKCYLDIDPMLKKSKDLYAQIDYNNLISEEKKKELGDSVDEHMNKLNSIISKYDI